jgi:hypothetical protein
MKPNRLLLIILAILVVGAFAYRQYSVDMAAWSQVQQSLIRLSSGIEFEPIITLRSKLADADAAMKTYESEFHIFSPQHQRRLESGKRGVPPCPIICEIRTSGTPAAANRLAKVARKS